MGVVLFAMVGGRFPFKFAHEKDPRYKLIIQRDFENFWKLFEKNCKFSDECMDLIQQMLEYDPEKRIKLINIHKHDWFSCGTNSITNIEEISKAISKEREKVQKMKRGNR